MDMEKSRIQLRQWLKIQDCTENVYVNFIKRYNLNKNSFFALDYLYTHPQGAEPAVLAKELGLMRQMITIVLNDLEKRNFIIRHGSKDDHRRKTIILSETGKTFAEKVCAALEDFDLAALTVFSEEELQKILEYTTRFYKKIQIQLESANESK